MSHYNEQREECLELDWVLNLKFKKSNPLESGQVIAVIDSEYVILDFDINNGGEFYRWNPEYGVMEKVYPKKFAVLPVATGDY